MCNSGTTPPWASLQQGSSRREEGGVLPEGGTGIKMEGMGALNDIRLLNFLFFPVKHVSH